MNKNLLYITFIIAGLVAAAFLPGPVAGVHANDAGQSTFQEPVNSVQSVDGATSSPSPIVQIVVGAAGLLFALLTFLPQLWQENYESAAIHGADFWKK